MAPDLSPCAFPALEERFGIRAWSPCWQAGYLSPGPLPELPFELRPLGFQLSQGVMYWPRSEFDGTNPQKEVSPYG